jgi:hypothetical protein
MMILKHHFWNIGQNILDRHDITEILLKVALNTIKQTNKQNILIEYIVTILKCNFFFIEHWTYSVNIVLHDISGKGVGSLITGQLYTLIGIRWTFRIYGILSIVFLLIYLVLNKFVFKEGLQVPVEETELKFDSKSK